MPREVRRKTPEQILSDVQAEERAVTKGRLKIFLGYASGVGKSFRMLDEARRRRNRGQDVVVGAVQPKMSPDLQELLKTLEVVPLKGLGHEIAIDMETLLRRRPMVCVVDGLAYDNPPDSRNPTRWQDVAELLGRGISIITSINVQYVAELSEQVEGITGKHVTYTVPVAFLKSAEEIEIVDAPPEESIERSPEEQTHAARREQQLWKLRELTLVLAANVVDYQLVEYLKSQGLNQNFSTNERILVCITPRANARAMIETGQFIANRFHGDLIVAYVEQPYVSPAEQAALDEKLQVARIAGASVEILKGENAAEAILHFVRSRGITQLFIGHSQRAGLWSRIWGNPVDKLIRGTPGVDIRVFPQ